VKGGGTKIYCDGGERTCSQLSAWPSEQGQDPERRRGRAGKVPREKGGVALPTEKASIDGGIQDSGGVLTALRKSDQYIRLVSMGRSGGGILHDQGGEKGGGGQLLEKKFPAMIFWEGLFAVKPLIGSVAFSGDTEGLFIYGMGKGS